MGDFLCEGLLADYVLTRLHGVVAWEYETIINTKYFMVNSKITALCSLNRSAGLTYMHTHTQVAAYWRVKMWCIPIPTLWSYAQICVHLVSRLSYTLPGALFFIHTHTGVIDCIFIYFFMCWSSRMIALLLCCHSVAPCTSKGGISVSAICHLWRVVFSFNMQVSLNRLSLAALRRYPMALYSASLHRGYSKKMKVVDCTLELTFHCHLIYFRSLKWPFWIRKEINSFIKL